MADDALYIDTPAALDALCARLKGSPWLAVDTEFMRERTYYPELCLVQVATGDTVACVDTIALPSLEPLLQVLLDTRTVKVLHAARQDLEIIFHLAGKVPAPVYDTQVAARFLGLPEQVGYAALVQHLLGVSLDKSQARADWARRPLSPAALAYAADDVRHLRTVYARLKTELETRGRGSWPEPEMRALEDERLYRPAPDNAWGRLRGLQRLKPRALAALKSLAAWRERTAIAENRPRQWILKDEVLMDLARQLPADAAALAALRGVGEALVKRHGVALLQILGSAGSDGERAPKPPAPLSVKQEAMVDALMAVLRLKAAGGDVSAASIANRAELERLVRGERQLPLLEGWRLEMAGRELLDFLEGRQALKTEAGALKLSGGS